MKFGAIFLGTLAERIGRRKAISICIFLFSVFTVAAGLTSDPVWFSVMRFLAGWGIGGVMPNVVAEVTEYSPEKRRSTLVTLIFSAYSVGGVLGKAMIESYGWQSVFFAAGLPVLLIPFIMRSLPESMLFLIKQNRVDELNVVAARLQPGYQARQVDDFTLSAEDEAVGAPIGKLFHEGRGFSTATFWVAFFIRCFGKPPPSGEGGMGACTSCATGD